MSAPKTYSPHPHGIINCIKFFKNRWEKPEHYRKWYGYCLWYVQLFKCRHKFTYCNCAYDKISHHDAGHKMRNRPTEQKHNNIGCTWYKRQNFYLKQMAYYIKCCIKKSPTPIWLKPSEKKTVLSPKQGWAALQHHPPAPPNEKMQSKINKKSFVRGSNARIDVQFWTTSCDFTLVGEP